MADAGSVPGGGDPSGPASRWPTAVISGVLALFFAKPAPPTWDPRAGAETARRDAPDERVPGAVA